MTQQRPRFPASLDATLGARAPRTGRAGSAATASTAGATASARGAVTGVGGAGLGLPSAGTVQVPAGVGLDGAAARTRMVQRLAAQGVQDAQVLAAMQAVERHRFVDSALVAQAYEDTSLPIGLGQTISKPSVVARMVELLLAGQLGQAGQAGSGGKLGRVLEIGTGCGYQAAVLSQVAQEVYSMERLRGLHDKARENLRPLRVPNIHLLFGDGMLGFPKGAPYAGIIAAAGGEAVPQAWVDQLAVGARLVAPVLTQSGSGQALLVLDKTTQGVRQTLLEAVNFVPLKSGIG